MTSLGYALSSEEHSPLDIVRYARGAEEAGFEFALISDHYHPWTESQGQSGFVWGMLGAIAQATERLVVGTGVTCPTMRIHPAIIAQAAATASVLMPRRFFLGVGSGEELNEHILGQWWPSARVRLEMLEEAIEVMRLLWKGGTRYHRGQFFTVDAARVYSLPEQPPAIFVAAGGNRSARMAGRLGDGLIATSPKAETVEAFREAGGKDKPRVGQVVTCWAESVEAGRETVMRYWPNAALGGALGQELPLPRDYEAATKTVRVEDIVELVPCGPDPAPYIEHVRKFEEAGFDHVYLHQVGPDQEGFFRFFERELRDELAPSPSSALRLAS